MLWLSNLEFLRLCHRDIAGRPHAAHLYAKLDAFEALGAFVTHCIRLIPGSVVNMHPSSSTGPFVDEMSGYKSLLSKFGDHADHKCALLSLKSSVVMIETSIGQHLEQLNKGFASLKRRTDVTSASCGLVFQEQHLNKGLQCKTPPQLCHHSLVEGSAFLFRYLAVRNRNSKVFMIGLPHTGAMSILRAVERFGYECFEKSMGAISSCGSREAMLPLPLASWLNDPQKVRNELKASMFWDSILRSADLATAFATGPFPYIYEDMDKLHPGSSFILTLPKGGADSYVRNEKRLWKQLGLLTVLANHYYISNVEEWLETRLRNRYNAHTAEVRAYFESKGTKASTKSMLWKKIAIHG